MKAVGFILMPVAFATFFSPKESPLGQVHLVAMGLFLFICLGGAFLGTFVVFGKLRMSCPFCGKSGRVGVDKQYGMWMECGTCGLVHGSGPLGLKIVCEELGDDDCEDDDA